MTDSPSSTTPRPEDPDFGPEFGAELGAEGVPQPSAKRRRAAARVRAWAAGRERRIMAGVAAVALVGAGGLALAATHGEHGRGHHQAMNWAEDSQDGQDGQDGQGEHGGRGGEHGGFQGEHGGEARKGGHGGQGHHHGGRQGDGEQGGGHGRDGNADGAAPAPLPSVAASAALEKAQGAVPGGRAESLERVTAQGGTAAWSVVVVGPDGVRHQVTVDGASGELTGNTVVDGSGR
ncbi:hypothetical protein ACWCXH_12415 [Kitasatospora sp. NPDC001660]